MGRAEVAAPALRSRVGRRASVATGAAAQTAHNAGVSLLRAVVVDDVEDVRVLLRAALRADGRFEVVGEAGDAAGAVAVVVETEPDLVLLDLAMPGGDGLAALPLLREQCPTARVVIVSGFPRGRLAELTVTSGAVGYVEKGLSALRLVSDVVAVAGFLEAVEDALARSRTSLPGDLASGAAARRFMTETLERWACADLVDTVNLLVSELVNNVVVHARSEAEVAVLLTPRALRVEVSDSSAAAPAPRDAAEDHESGRGMALVEALATDWGVRPRPDGKTVWFEVPRPDA